MRTYKQKRHAIAWDRDADKCNRIRKYINTVERQAAKKDIMIGMDDNEEDMWMREMDYESTNDVVGDYNMDIASDLRDMLNKVAPELGWADTDDSWGYGYHYSPRALSALGYYWQNWRPSNEWDQQELIIEAFSKRDRRWHG